MTSDGKIIIRGNTSSITRVTRGGLKRVYIKARPGRGRKRAAWVDAVHQDLREEFDRLRKLGVKFNICTLKSLALHLIDTSDKDSYCRNQVDPRTDNPIVSMISKRWIQSFMERFRIVSRAQSGKLQLSPKKEEMIHKRSGVLPWKLVKRFQEWSNR